MRLHTIHIDIDSMPSTVLTDVDDPLTPAMTLTLRHDLNRADMQTCFRKLKQICEQDLTRWNGESRAEVTS